MSVNQREALIYLLLCDLHQKRTDQVQNYLNVLQPQWTTLHEDETVLNTSWGAYFALRMLNQIDLATTVREFALAELEKNAQRIQNSVHRNGYLQHPAHRYLLHPPEIYPPQK